MKIALLGYGKMGKAIEIIANEMGHEIVATLDFSPKKITELNNAQVCIEFTNPEVATQNIEFCIENKIPVVVGTTGWYNDFERIKQYCIENKSALFTATNFSIGVNLFWEVNKKLAQIMNTHSEYQIEMTEIHHTEKKDAPSGTAITTAEKIIENANRFSDWILKENDDKTSQNSTIPITALREPNVPGTHTVTYKSEVDEIILTHQAYSRKGFAKGAVIAAQWIVGKQGVFGMEDLLK